MCQVVFDLWLKYLEKKIAHNMVFIWKQKANNQYWIWARSNNAWKVFYLKTELKTDILRSNPIGFMFEITLFLERHSSHVP